METLGYALVFLAVATAIFMLGYLTSKWYWYERGYCDAQDVMTNYARSRERANRDAHPRLGSK